MKTILIAGGAGFVGSWLCERLVNEGNQVICVDNLLTGSKENIKHLMGKPNFKFLELDISKNCFLKNIEADLSNLDQIFNSIQELKSIVEMNDMDEKKII